MLQEWIPGDMSKTIIIDGFVDRHGDIRAHARPPAGADGSAQARQHVARDVTIPLTELEACLPALRTLLAATGYRGIFMVEFKFDERDGRSRSSS